MKTNIHKEICDRVEYLVWLIELIHPPDTLSEAELSNFKSSKNNAIRSAFNTSISALNALMIIDDSRKAS